MISPAWIEVIQEGDLTANLLSLPLLHALGQSHSRSRLRMSAPPACRDLFALAGLELEDSSGNGAGPADGSAVRLDLRIATGPPPDGPWALPPDGPRSVPLWRQYLELAERRGLGPQTAPGPPYLFPPAGPADPCTRRSVGRIVLAMDTAPRAGGWYHDHFAQLEFELHGQADIETLTIEEGNPYSGLRICSLEAGGGRSSPLSLRDTTSLLRGAALLVSNQRSLLCLGAALGLPGIGLFGLEDEPRFYEPLDGGGTLLVAFERPLAELSPLEVAAYVNDYLTADPRDSDWRRRKRLIFVC